MAEKDSRDWIEFVDDHIVCRVCGSRVERGIISVSGHWAECQGKEIMVKVNAIADKDISTDDKIKEVKNLFKL